LFGPGDRSFALGSGDGDSRGWNCSSLYLCSSAIGLFGASEQLPAQGQVVDILWTHLFFPVCRPPKNGSRQFFMLPDPQVGFFAGRTPP